MYIRDLRPKSSNNGISNGGSSSSGNKKTVLFDTHHNWPTKPKVRPLEEQGVYESRRLWKKVTDALAKRDHKVATEEKFKIENDQGYWLKREWRMVWSSILSCSERVNPVKTWISTSLNIFLRIQVMRIR